MQKYYITLPENDNPKALKFVEAHGLTISMLYASRQYMLNRNKHEIAEDVLSKSGVYILIGTQPNEELQSNDELPLVYIGQSDNLGERIRNHIAKKKWWEKALVFSNSQPFSITAIKTIESSLHSIAATTKKCKLENSQIPQIPKSAIHHGEIIKNDVQQILDLVHMLGFDFLESDNVVQSTKTSTPEMNYIFEFNGLVRRQTIQAKARYQDGDMVVCAGSLCTNDHSEDCPDSIIRLRKELIELGVIVTNSDNTFYIFSQDYSFTSASAASGVVTGRSSNGKTDWKTVEGVTLRDWLSPESTN